MAPGVLFQYQNENFIIAGAMLENLFNDSWENLITQYLFQPLGMTSAGLAVQPPVENRSPGAIGTTTGCTRRPTPTISVPGPSRNRARLTRGLGKFIRLYLTGQEGGVTLTASTRTTLMTAYTSSDPWFAWWPVSYGWGWGISAERRQGAES